jgi:Bacterial SH3 domain
VSYDRAPMRRVLLSLTLIAVCRCAAPPPPEPVPVAPPAAVVREAQEGEKVIGTVRVTASALNVRAEASTEASVVTQVKKGQALDVLREDEAWVKVRLANGETGWVASRFVSSGNAPARTAKAKRSGCPADSDYAFTETPTLAFSDSGAHGMVVVEAAVNAKGVVTATKVVSNGTGDDALAFLAEREIKGAKFSPPIRNCFPRSFIFTYRRTF